MLSTVLAASTEHHSFLNCRDRFFQSRNCPLSMSLIFPEISGNRIIFAKIFRDEIHCLLVIQKLFFIVPIDAFELFAFKNALGLFKAQGCALDMC